MSSIPTHMQACQIQSQGGLEVISVSSIPVPVLAKNQVLVKVEYAGVNFIDTYQRGGVYKLPMPFVLGNECSGTVVQVGPGVDAATYGYGVGDKVAAYTAGGSFAEYAVAVVEKCVKLPTGVSTKDAATILLQGLTAVTLMKASHDVQKGQYIMVQAAAGGLGLLLCQLGKHLGAHIIGTTSTKEKAALALESGAEHCLLYDGSVNVVEEVFKITGGEGLDRGVHAVFDGVGKDTFEMDLEILRRQGSLVSVGNASGPVPPVAPLRLGPKNLKLSRPVLNQALYTIEEFKHYSTQLFDLVNQGVFKMSVWEEYPLSTEGITKAQVDIMSRKTSGKLLVKV